MRKFIASNLLTVMFLVGAASGFFVSNIGWWGLQQGAQDLDRLYSAGTVNLQKIFGVEASLVQSQMHFLKMINMRQRSPNEALALMHTDVELNQLFSQLQQGSESREFWKQSAALYSKLSASQSRILSLLVADPDAAYRLYASETQPLFDQLLQSLQQFAPLFVRATEQAYRKASEDNRNARNTLLAMALLASVFFCLIAWHTYRESIERKLKTAQLNRAHARFKTLFESTGDGIILMDMERLLECNKAARKLFALPTQALISERRFSQLYPVRQPDDCDSEAVFNARIADSLRLGSQRFEWTFQSETGVTFPAEVAMDVAYMGDENIIQVTIRNIAERKKTESAMRLAAQVFESSLEGVTITDAKANILTVNRAFTKITGYQPDEMIGHNPRMLSSGRQNREFYEEFWSSINLHGHWQGEIWNRRKNGDIYPQWMKISRVQDEHQKTINYVGVFSDITERKAAEERILHQINYDQLTQLPNRILFMDRLSQSLALSMRYPENDLAVMFLDLDRFKLINDSMGHAIGDELLKQVAQRLTQCVRETDTVARLSGDEFTIILTKLGGAKAATVVANKIINCFKEPFPLNWEEVFVSVSIGISLCPGDGTDSATLLKNADMAMYRAKSAGGSAFALYDENFGLQATKRLTLETELHKALERDELELHYQPQFDCRSGKLTGLEALLRWRHPERGLVSPNVFITIAEETGLIIPIGAWVLETACRQAQAWFAPGKDNPLIAVNLSARQLQHPDIVQHVTTALEKSGLPPAGLELEITESVVMQNIDASVEIMLQLAKLGAQFSIDDFGTGYSSLAYLKKMPISALKIDKSFIRDIVTDRDDAAIVGAIVAMSNKLGLRVVAEGIEDKLQLEHLKEHSGISVQGYLLGRPLDVNAMTDVIQKEHAKLIPA
jgi:diguanylate cyclase (GGDEF)-like protein/PAS domain S-box-containing protein